MRHSNLLLAVALYCLLSGSVAWAGLPHWRRPQVASAPDTYAPETRHYNVVEPVVVGHPTTKDFGHNVPPPGQVLWRQKVEPAPTYPWGWFGARRHWNNSQHRRYYGDARDWSYLRGD